MISGISGLALQWYVSVESLAGTMACMSTAFVLVDNLNLGTWRRGLLGSQERRARSRMYVKRKGKGVQGFSLFRNGQHHQPAWYKRSCSVFYRARKGAALDVEVYEIAPSCMSTDNGTASGIKKTPSDYRTVPLQSVRSGALINMDTGSRVPSPPSSWAAVSSLNRKEARVHNLRP